VGVLQHHHWHHQCILYPLDNGQNIKLRSTRSPGQSTTSASTRSWK
jgi:hypothetical protein